MLAFGVEAFVFAYLGLSIFGYYNSAWSWQFILVEMIIIVLGRFMSTFGLIYFMVLFGHKKRVTFKELVFISFSGMIRGPIAFGLVLRLPDDFPHRDVIVTTVLTIVILTTLLYGSTMPLVQRMLLVSKL